MECGGKRQRHTAWDQWVHSRSPNLDLAGILRVLLRTSDTEVRTNGASLAPVEAKAVSAFVPHSATALHTLAGHEL